jgi:2-polyprenyl-3-methyl-5-hydroxy-6-metoxy-1,4-benzoquinol methylase
MTDVPSCDVCRTTASDLLWTTTWPEHGYPGTFAMRRCRECGLLFNSPRLDDTELARLYGSNYYFFARPDAREFARIVPMYLRTVALVSDEIKDKRSLDIGCGRGYLPALLRRLGWDAKGVEISPEAADHARVTFGLDVFTGTIEQYADSASRQEFELVTAIDVIEHVPAPRDFVAAIAKVTRRGGWVIIDTPNAAAANIATRGTQWPGFNPFHIFLFTIENLTRLLVDHGLMVERAFSYHNQPQSRSMRDTIASALKAMGLLGVAARGYFRLKSIGSEGRGEDLLNRAANAAGAGIPWDRSADASAPLAASHRGDNIVLIAKRT